VSSVIVASGGASLGLPSWGRCFWQDPNDGRLVLLYASGSFEVDYITSADSGVTWSSPSLAFPVDGFDVHNNFDTEMDRAGNVHCVFRYSDSGCYQLLAKDFIGGDWAPSGIGPAGFCSAGDTGSAKGFQGNIMVLDEKVLNTPVEDQSQLPHLFIAAKNADNGVGAYHLHNPFGHTPSGLFAKSANIPTSISGAGIDGGFPFLVDAGPGGDTGPSVKIIFRLQESGHMSLGRAFGAWRYRYHPYPSGGAANTTLGGSFNNTAQELETGGYYSRLLLNPNIAVSRCGDQRNWLCIIPNKSHVRDRRQLEWDFNQPPWDFLTADYQGFLNSSDEAGALKDSGFNLGDVFVNLRGSRGYSDPPSSIGGVVPMTTVGRGIPATGNIPSDNGIFRTDASGTACDISWRDKPGRIHLYFMNRDSSGKQVISRIMSDVKHAGKLGADKNQTLQFSFSEILAPTSGIHSWAPSDKTFVGGSGCLFAWNNFKALHHPVDQGSGVFKQEIVVTAGATISGALSSLVVWDYDKSVDSQFSLRLPDYTADRTMATGIGTKLLSIGAIGFGPENAFDGKLGTSTNISKGDVLTLGFDQVYPFSRVELAWRAPTFGNRELPAIDIQSSFDGVTFKSVGTIPTGVSIEPANFASPQPVYPDRLVKATSEVELGFVDRTISSGSYIMPFVGKFIRLLFAGAAANGKTNNVPVYQIRLYGPSQTPNKWVTSGFEKDLVAAKGTESSVEKFDGVFEFSSLPPGWRATGDWDWFVRASGNLTKPNGLPTAQPTQLGTIQSGIFVGQSVGNGDGSALRTAEWMSLNSSGVVEVDIDIAITEVDSSGAPGRNIQWDTRYHKIGAGVTIPAGPEDDEFNFYAAPTGAPASTNMGQVKGFFTQGPCFVGTCQYFTVSTDIPPGKWTLRWVFRRGSTANIIPIAGDEAVAYIDNVRGLDGPPLTSIFGYMRGESFATGVIHGYMKKAKWSSVDVYTKGYFWFEPRHGFMVGQPHAFSSVNAYMLGNKEGQVLGYMLGGSGLLSIPTGITHGYVAVQSGITKQVYGYLLGNKQAQILGWLSAASGFQPPSGIHGYMMVPDMTGIIYGGVNMGVSGTPSERVLGFLANREFESVRGFVAAPPGAFSSVFGYIPPQPTGVILGYMRGLSSATGTIFTFMKVADAESDVFGYLPASGDDLVGSQQRVHGYLFNAGASEEVFGYLNVLQSAQVYGYMKGNVFASGSVNAWTSGIGFENSIINGYIAGISGNASGSINSYLIGVEIPSSVIDGYLIGFDDCVPHGTVPLPALPAFTIPTGNFINNC